MQPFSQCAAFAAIGALLSTVLVLFAVDANASDDPFASSAPIAEGAPFFFQQPAQVETLTPLCDLFACGFDDVGVTECEGCYDLQLNRSETDIDCGGPSCIRCADGRKCAQGDDCTSLVCNPTSHACSAPTCTDAVKNGAESDVDCGGLTCPPCGDGRSCQVGTDCSSHVCNPGNHTCSAPSCNDLVKNGSETDVDCGGGSCMPCGFGKICLVGSDCTSHVCNPANHTCSAPSCNDLVKNGSETDIDCGGGTCMPCGFGKTCLIGSDCTSHVCNPANHTCSAPTCNDLVKNGSETDVDCGGGTCPHCTSGKTCLVGSDCVSGVCTAGGTCQ